MRSATWVLQDKESTYWHFITDGNVEDERQCDFNRCARIKWPRAMMERCPTGRPAEDDVVLWWKTVRNNEQRYVLALPDFSYIVILVDRGEFVLPWTAYTVEERHRRAKLSREYEAYWEGIK